MDLKKKNRKNIYVCIGLAGWMVWHIWMVFFVFVVAFCFLEIKY